MAATAQEILLRLEKENAPVQEQVQQAAVFAGIKLSNSENPEKVGETSSSVRVGHHGRQEYTLRWLLKKWSNDGEQGREARGCPEAWKLLTTCLDDIPVRNAARILQERKFGILLRNTIEEAVEGMKPVLGQSNAAVAGKASKKRRRDGSPVATESTSPEVIFRLRHEIYHTVDRIVRLSQPGFGGNDAFEAEYMKSVLRMPSDDAAKVLGGWLKWILIPRTISSEDDYEDGPSSCVEVWMWRITSSEDGTVFLQHCAEPLLKLLSLETLNALWKPQLEQLLARNVILPAKLAYEAAPGAGVLSHLVSILSREPKFSIALFDVSIRSLQPHGARRRLNDSAWLQAVFIACTEAISTAQSEILAALLDRAVNNRVSIDLPVVSSIVSKYAFTKETQWNVVFQILRLDSNVFLAPAKSEADEGENLLQDLLNRITKTTVVTRQKASNIDLCEDIVIPLMTAFATARNLTAFVHHWYEELRQFEKLRPKSKSKLYAIPDPSVWEDDKLPQKLVTLMESSLTTQQILDLTLWAVKRMEESNSAAYVILDAIAEAVTQDETVDTVGEIFYSLALNVEAYEGLDDRYRGRPWRILAKTFKWVSEGQKTSLESEPITALRELLQKCIEMTNKDVSGVVSLQGFKCICAGWTLSIFGEDTHALLEILKDWAQRSAKSLTSLINILHHDWSAKDNPWKDGGKRSEERQSVQYLAETFAHCIYVEYPQVLEVLLNGPERRIFQDLIWLASATTPFSHDSSPVPWLRQNHDIFPSIIRSILSNEYILNNRKMIRPIIDTLLECSDHVNNPIEIARACNGFVVNSLLQLPIEVFSRAQREHVLQLWSPVSPDPSQNDREALSHRMTTLDPAVLSLKIKTMRLPTLHQGIVFTELVQLAECVETLSPKPRVLLPLLSEFAALTLGHVFATVGQAKSIAYIVDMLQVLDEWVETGNKSKHKISVGMMSLVQVALSTVGPKVPFLEEQGVLNRGHFDKIQASYKQLLLSTLHKGLQKVEKFKRDDSERCIVVYCALDALDAMRPSEGDLETMIASAKTCVDELRTINPVLGRRLETFLIEHAPSSYDVETSTDVLGGDITTIDGRRSIHQRVQALTLRLSEPGKLQLANGLLKEDLQDAQTIDKLLALRYALSSINDKEKDISLSSSYSELVVKLSGASDIRNFCLIAEVMELLLSKKPHSINQYNIDDTISIIGIVCTSAALPLPRNCAGTIHLHLTSLFHAILTSHWKKLQGHFHMPITALVALLRCLFVPLTNNHKSSQPPPAWLPTIIDSEHLGVIHAAAYARLITFICSPPVSVVSRQKESLSDPTAKAKRTAAQHMPNLLSAYIQMQLDLGLKMSPDVRKTLTPAIYAIFDTMTQDQRRSVAEGLDAGGRAFLHTLVGDWRQWGQWKGN